MLLTTFLPLGGVALVTLGARAVPWQRLSPRLALWALTSAGPQTFATTLDLLRRGVSTLPTDGADSAQPGGTNG